ncbi:4Fe-4S ferredoxin-type domain-containing protein [Entamoeba marina]
MAQVKINTDLCVGCGQCAKECPSRVLAVENGKAAIVEKNAANCISCGHCGAICAQGAISLFDIVPNVINNSKESVEGSLKIRRSIRSFKGAIPNEELKEIINISKHAPSACNYRPLKFLVINRPKLTELLSELSKKSLTSEVIPKQIQPVLQAQEKIDIIGRGAPHMIVAYVESTCEMWGVDDASIALSEIELYATSKGYGSFWCGFLKIILSDPNMMEFIGLKDKKCCGCLGMGIPAVHFSREVPRKDVDISFME